MSTTRQTTLASRPAAMVLALTLAAGLTAPFLLLPRAQAAATPPATLSCTVGNYNGCTELSATPPEDTVSVPPNIVLMLDDSGSMDYDYMPDWDSLPNNSLWGVRNSDINDVYYNPATTYSPPPKADGTSYPDSPSLTGAYNDGFTDTTHTKDVRSYSTDINVDNGHNFVYGVNFPTTEVTTTNHDYGKAVWGGGTPGSPGSPGSPGGNCPGGYRPDPGNPGQCIRDPVPPTQKWKCNSGDGNPYKNHGTEMCHHYVYEEGHRNDYPYPAIPNGFSCPSGSSLQGDNLCHYPVEPVTPPTPPTPPTSPTPNYKWTCPSGGSTNAGAPPPPSDPPECTSTSGSRAYVWVFIYVLGTPVQANAHFVVPNGAGAPAGGWCSVLLHNWHHDGGNYGNPTPNCVDEDDTSGTAAPGGVAAGQNIANWFSYYRSRLLATKSGLMIAFSTLDSRFRFGFASINANGVKNIPGVGSTPGPTPHPFDDSSAGGGSGTNQLAVAQPFGDGSSGTQKALFWDWLANESANNGTPLRKALNAAGQYYQTAQPWSTMPGDPGYTSSSTTKFACRASYTILTTDGFWNGDAPSGIGYAAGADGPDYSPVPSGAAKQYVAEPPFSGGGVGGSKPSLADVATYYWETDLQGGLANEVGTSTADPAPWQHMTTFTIGLGFDPVGIQPLVGTPPASPTITSILTWAQTGTPPTGVTASNFSWPTPASNNINNIADLAHAAVNGHGGFFSAKSAQDLTDAINQINSEIAGRNTATPASAVNASVLSLGAVSFSTGYSTKDWTGQFDAVTLNSDGTPATTPLWSAGSKPAVPPATGLVLGTLDKAFHSAAGYKTRNVYTAAYTVAGGVGTFGAFPFTAANKASLDSTEMAGLGGNLDCTASGDTLCNRIDYLLGDNTHEGAPYRARTSILGAIIHSEPVYVAGATGDYSDNWPSFGTPSVTAPEAVTGVQKYDAFVTQQASNQAMVYVGADDGMLHAFEAPVPQCSTGKVDADGNCSGPYTFLTGTNPGKEAWAFVPRAVYANLGNLTNAADFQFRPTVGATPVKRDVFFSDGGPGNNKWHTLLAGGVGLGGRGVYALDITDPGDFEAPISSYPAAGVLWEFDSDMTPASDCVASYGTCKATDLGYTVSQPNIGRLHNGKWAVLVSNGYFPDCSQPDTPTNNLANCQAIAKQAPKNSSGQPYSALFVLNAQTGKMIAELKTPTGLGVTSFGLATPVIGDYNNDQVDDVAFAGDVQGNLWRFDLSDPKPLNWTVTLVYQGISVDGHQGVQSITSMPRLFPDPVTNRFMVVFGTGRFLGVGDNSNVDQQAIYAVRDVLGQTYKQAGLTPQYLHETTAPAFLPDGTTPNPNAGASLRCVTGGALDTCTSSPTSPTSPTTINQIPASSGGWYIDLKTTTSGGVLNDAGERVVVNPGAIFSSNTVIFETLITGSLSSDACSPSTQGSILALNAISGGSAGVSSLGGGQIAGARINNARTSGSLPLVSALGGGQAYLPGTTLAPTGTNPLSLDAPIWRRRSWHQIQQNQ